MERNTLVIIVAIGYIIVLPIIFRLIAFAQKKLIVDRKAASLGNNKAALKNIPRPVWPQWKERISFTFKDKRMFSTGKDNENPSGVTRSQLFIILYLSGLVLSVGSVFFNLFPNFLIPLGYALFFGGIVFAIKSADPVLKTRQSVMSKMFEIVRSKLGASIEYEQNPGAVIRIQKWKDYVVPEIVEIDVPTTFSAEGQEGFLKQYNQVFGVETTWVPLIDPDKKIYGWDYEKGIVTIYAVPPLPKIALWDESYVLSDDIAWSFFPIGLGVENGVEITNPKTGQVENVLGFDLSGEQEKLSKERGLKMHQKITTSPQVFIGGGTGGGKALPVDTLVEMADEE